ncbi:MAG TPA: hypothetical protein VHA13_05115, partial [Gammaproteobacteria bacterium]|nr:hypothetical protein [Gammaproteobacteria bacterium]
IVKELLASAFELFEHENSVSIKSIYCVQSWWGLKTRKYGEQIYPAMQEAINAVDEFLQSNTGSSRLISALESLQNEVKGPYLYRQENTLFRKFLGTLYLILGLAMAVTSIVMMPFLTLAGACATGLISGMVIGRGVNLLRLEAKAVTNDEQQAVNSFAQSAKALIRTKGAALFNPAPKNEQFKPFGGKGYKLGS